MTAKSTTQGLAVAAALVAGLTFVPFSSAASFNIVTENPFTNDTLSGGDWAARLRSFGNTGANEVYIGQGDIGNGANRNEARVNWSNNTTGPNSFVFSYSPGEIALGGSGSTTGSASWNLGSGFDNPFDAFVIELRVQNRTGRRIVLEDIVFQVDGEGQQLLGDMSAPTDQDFLWGVIGLPASALSQGFTVSGSIGYEVGWRNGSQEAIRVNFNPGTFNDQAAPIPEPGTITLFGIGLAGFALSHVRRRRKGRIG